MSMLTVYGLVGGASCKIEPVRASSATMPTRHTNRQKVVGESRFSQCVARYIARRFYAKPNSIINPSVFSQLPLPLKVFSNLSRKKVLL